MVKCNWLNDMAMHALHKRHHSMCLTVLLVSVVYIFCFICRENISKT